MDDEIARLRKAIWRSFGSSPHKRKYWLALLEMHGPSLGQKLELLSGDHGTAQDCEHSLEGPPPNSARRGRP